MLKKSVKKYKNCNKDDKKCKTRKFLYDPNDPKKSFDVYIFAFQIFSGLNKYFFRKENIYLHTNLVNNQSHI